ncbi:MAG: RDD family protein [Candidatus Heimdallarchaeota archaeon]
MAVEKEIIAEAEFLRQVNSWLPPRASQKDEWLQELSQDLQAAYEDTSARLPTSERWQEVLSEFGPPQEVAKNLVSSRTEAFTRVSYSRRVFAYLIDLLITISLAILVALPIVGVLYFVIVHGDVLTDSNTLAIILFLLVVNLLIILVIMALLGYFVVLERHWGATVGKKLLGIQVVSETGLRITWQQAIVRNLSKLNEQFLLFDWLIGWLMKTDRQRGLDVAAKTQVVYNF